MRNFNPELQGEALEKRLQVVEKLKVVAENIHKPLSELALNWLISEQTVATIVCGARNEKQIEENVEATTWKLDSETLSKVNTILDQAGF